MVSHQRCCIPGKALMATEQRREELARRFAGLEEQVAQLSQEFCSKIHQISRCDEVKKLFDETRSETSSTLSGWCLEAVAISCICASVSLQQWELITSPLLGDYLAQPLKTYRLCPRQRMADVNFLPSGAGTAATASAAARAANDALRGPVPMQIDPGTAGPLLMAKDGDSPRKIESSIFQGDEGGRGRGRGRGRNSQKPQPKAAAPEFQGYAAYPQYPVNPAMPSMPSMPYMPPGPGYAPYMPSQYMMPPPHMNMYLGMPAAPMMFPPVPPVAEQGAPKNAKPRNRPDQGGGKNNGPREAKGKRRAKGKNAKEEPAAAVEDDETLSTQLNQVRRQLREVPLEEVLQENLVAEFAKDQYGTRYIQQKLDEAPEDVKKQVYAAICADAPELAKDSFGNHLVQKIFDSADAQQLGRGVSGCRPWHTLAE
eukprot:symbB.v1.2.032381.t1/scaffold3885.1/size48838/5